MDSRRPVGARQCAEIVDGRAVAAGCDEGTQGSERPHMHTKEIAVLVQRQPGDGIVVAALIVAEMGFRAFGRPFHRLTDATRRPHHQHLFRVNAATQTEAAADIASDHPHVLLGNAKHLQRHLFANLVGIVTPGIERIALIHRVVVAEIRPGLYRVGDGPGNWKSPLHHDVGILKRHLRFFWVAALLVEAFVIGAVFPDGRRIVIHRDRRDRIGR